MSSYEFRQSALQICGRPIGAFTVVELLVTVAVLMLSLLIAIPAVTAQVEKQRVISAAETISRDMYRARAEALRRNQDVALSFDMGAGSTPPPWCYGLNVGGGCDCNTSNDCSLDAEEVRKGGSQAGASFPDVRLDGVTFSGNQLVFSPARGLSNAGTVKVSSRDGDSPDERRLEVRVSTLGRIRICSPSGTYEKIGRYPACG